MAPYWLLPFILQYCFSKAAHFLQLAGGGFTCSRSIASLVLARNAMLIQVMYTDANRSF